MWFSLEGFRASRRKQNPLKGLEEGASGGVKKKTKSPRVPPGLRGAGWARLASPEPQHPLLAGSGSRSRARPPGWGGVKWGEDLRRREIGVPQRPPLSFPAAGRPGQRQDAAADTPEPRGRSPRPPRRLF